MKGSPLSDLVKALLIDRVLGTAQQGYPPDSSSGHTPVNGVDMGCGN